MLEYIDNDWTKGSYIWFQNLGNIGPGGERTITSRFDILSEDNTSLGRVKWFGRWRKYCFSPVAETVYEEVCLGEIAEFCKEMTKRHRENAKKNR